MNSINRMIQWASCMFAKHSNWKMPEVIDREDSFEWLASDLQKRKILRPLLVTTAGTIKRGMLDDFMRCAKSKGIDFAVFTEVSPDPTIDCVESGVSVYNESVCDGIVAVGGGSVMDCAKIIGARIVKPAQPVRKMKGMMKIHKKLPPFYAIPTTAGTGSETTVAAVITDGETHYKYAITDNCLLPEYAILNPELTRGLPPALTATTGMDALTHAVEAYTNLYSGKDSDAKAKDAVKLIWDNLLGAVENGDDMDCRRGMLLGSFYAGEAFTRSFVGYVHAIAHALGGMYGIAHGEANAIILPHVLSAYGDCVYDKLAELADCAGITGSTGIASDTCNTRGAGNTGNASGASDTGDTGSADDIGNAGGGASASQAKQKAEAFIAEIIARNERMNIARNIPPIRETDLPEIMRRVQKEAAGYPTPKIFSNTELESLLLEIKGA